MVSVSVRVSASVSVAAVAALVTANGAAGQMAWPMGNSSQHSALYKHSLHSAFSFPYTRSLVRPSVWLLPLAAVQQCKTFVCPDFEQRSTHNFLCKHTYICTYVYIHSFYDFLLLCCFLPFYVAGATFAAGQQQIVAQQVGCTLTLSSISDELSNSI